MSRGCIGYQKKHVQWQHRLPEQTCPGAAQAAAQHADTSNASTGFCITYPGIAPADVELTRRGEAQTSVEQTRTEKHPRGQSRMLQNTLVQG
jgi:hypothetical protein